VPNVDFVADGHTHKAVAPHRIGETFYGNGGRYLENFLEITIGDDGRGRMELKTYDDLAGLDPDRLIAGKVAEIDHSQGLSEIILESPDFFSDQGLRAGNIALGRLICSAMIRAAGADMAFHNNGGIRAGLPAGPVNARDLFDVLPFGDVLTVVNLSGREILERFGQGSDRGGHGRGWPQFYGLKVYAWQGNNGELTVAGLKNADGAPLDLDRHYRVAMNGFMARFLERPAEKHGGMIEALRRELKSGFNFEEFRPNRSLFVFATQKEAQAAWEGGEP
jgi:2',3'-cyclic-nucleotide 2'-phosphodiesterase (5'-nucleotidase family)